MIHRQVNVALVVTLVCQWFRTATAHGRLWEPPSRSSMWRRGWDTPANYNDMQLFCGGFDATLSSRSAPENTRMSTRPKSALTFTFCSWQTVLAPGTTQVEAA
ncbi:unnamed protein product [Candidula unifasciata]|uniref:Secreted protein n=1 Tax=Candidula unifasciata TaxID=100452 RepID=A0A8S3ZQ38_9EUPU|nr:unnamed protein product [Candidula unifasciata]